MNRIAAFCIGSGAFFGVVYAFSLPNLWTDNVSVASVLPYAALCGAIAGAITYPLQYLCLRKVRLWVASSTIIPVVSITTGAVTATAGAGLGLVASFSSLFVVYIVLIVTATIIARRKPASAVAEK